MHKIFIPSPKAVKLQLCNLTSVSFRRHFLVCSRAEHVKLIICRLSVFVELPLFRALCCLFLATLLRFFERLTVAGNWTRCGTQYVQVYASLVPRPSPSSAQLNAGVEKRPGPFSHVIYAAGVITRHHAGVF